MSFYREHWQGSPKFYLIPLSFLFRFIVCLRRQCYQKGLFKVTRVGVPVIVVGNISVGGTGKTPFVIALAQLLKSQGFSPGIVSRGYGGTSTHYPYEVTLQSDPREVGDESLVLVLHSQCPVVIAPQRVKAAQYLLQKTACDVVICDDGLQHYALARDIEIVVVDGKRRMGNGYCLPAGPLRESTKRLQEVDYVVVNGETDHTSEYAMKIIPHSFVNLVTPHLTKKVNYFQGKQVHAVAGIGHPQRFFDLLTQLGMSVIPHFFSDHYFYTENDLVFNDSLPILMTEKDAVKCKSLAKENMWYLSIHASLPALLGKKILSALNSIKDGISSHASECSHG